MSIISAVLAVLAIFLGVFSFIRHEDRRICTSAVALGGAALAWQFLMIAVIVIVIAMIIGAVMSQLGFG